MVARVVVINDASVARGGATGLACLSMRLLRERGFPVTAVVGDEGQNPEFPDLDVEVVALGMHELVKTSKWKAATRGLYNKTARDLLQNWISENDTSETVYHVHGWSKILSPSIFDALRPVADRTIVHAHDFFLACPNGAFMDYQALSPCDRVPLGFSCLSKHCDKRSYPQKLWRVSRQMRLSKSFDKTAPWSKIVMIHEKMAPYFESAGYAPAFLKTIRNPAEGFSDARVQAENNKEFVFVGRVEAEKGIEELIAGAEAADVPLKVIGDGPLREKLSQQHPKMSFSGWKNRQEISQLIANARALVMPSRYPEPFGLVVAEASASGLPILISRTAFLSEQVAEEGLGFAFDARDTNMITHTLKKLRDLPHDDVKAMSERGFSRQVVLAHAPGDWIAELISSYEAALA